jgi:hypothetical protein
MEKRENHHFKQKHDDRTLHTITNAVQKFHRCSDAQHPNSELYMQAFKNNVMDG